MLSSCLSIILMYENTNNFIKQHKKSSTTTYYFIALNNIYRNEIHHTSLMMTNPTIQAITTPAHIFFMLHFASINTSSILSKSYVSSFISIFSNTFFSLSPRSIINYFTNSSRLLILFFRTLISSNNASSTHLKK